MIIGGGGRGLGLVIVDWTEGSCKVLMRVEVILEHCPWSHDSAHLRIMGSKAHWNLVASALLHRPLGSDKMLSPTGSMMPTATRPGPRRANHYTSLNHSGAD